MTEGYVRMLSAGGDPVEPLELDSDTQARLDEALDAIDRARSSALRDGATYVIR